MDSATNQEAQKRLALRLRPLRATAFDGQPSQRQVAEAAGIAPRALSDYERCQEVPTTLANFYRFKVLVGADSMESLIDPEHRAEIEADVAARAAEFGLKIPTGTSDPIYDYLDPDRPFCV